ncbi:hypothetical protein V8G54_010900, partial [Vigna mungo]
RWIPSYSPITLSPQKLPFSDLLLLPRRARLPTLLAAKTISVTDKSPANFSLDHTPLTHPDLFFTPSLAVLDYSLFGDGLPLSPSPPAGNSIDVLWNSGVSSFDSHLNSVVLLPLFPFVLPLLLCQGFSISFEREREKRTFGLQICFSSTTVAATFNGDGDRK